MKKARYYEHNYTLHVPIWDDDIIICLTSDLLKAYKTKFPLYLANEKTNVDEHSVACMTPYDGGDYTLVLIFNVDRSNAGHIAHESLHATHQILKSHSIDFNSSTEETYAYTVAFLVQHITDLFKKVPRKKK